MQTVSEDITEQVRRSLMNAMMRMKDAGFEIRSPVEVVVDPNLPFMGYTNPQGRGFRIVASGMAAKSGMLEGLLVHELSHIYRMQTNHPSHNGRLIEGVVNNLEKDILSREYKVKIIRDLVNDIEDLYADDIAVKVMTEGQIIPKDQLSEFIQDWVKDEPVKSNFPVRDRWINTAIMAKNARAISQMVRHGIEDNGGKAADANKRLLSRFSPEKSAQFEYFKNLMTNLQQDITEEDYRRLLTNHLNRFVEIAET